jgi:hypothetical protein
VGVFGVEIETCPFVTSSLDGCIRGDTSWSAEDFHYFLHLTSLEGDSLFVVHFDFLTFEYWFQCQEFGKDASESPHISQSAHVKRVSTHSRRIMFCA